MPPVSHARILGVVSERALVMGSVPPQVHSSQSVREEALRPAGVCVAYCGRVPAPTTLKTKGGLVF